MENSTEHIHIKENALYTIGLLITTLGVCGNGFVLFIYLRSKDLRSPSMKTSMKVALNLASSDLLRMACLSLSSILLLFDLNMSYYVCFITISFPIYMSLVSQCVLGITTLDRYIAICHHQKYAKIMTERSLITLLVLAWLIPLPVSIFPLFGFNYWNEVQACIAQFMFHESIFSAQSIFFITIMVFSVALYIPILLKAREFHLRTYPAQFQGINARTTRLKARKRALRKSIIIGILTLTFMLCNLPFSIVRFQLGIGYSGNKMTFNVTLILGILNSVVNPFLYACQNTDFRRDATRFVKCTCFMRDYTDGPDQIRNIQQEQILPAQRPPHTTRNLHSQGPLPIDDHVGRSLPDSTAEDKTTGIARPKIIYVQAYQHAQCNIDETSL